MQQFEIFTSFCIKDRKTLLLEAHINRLFEGLTFIKVFTPKFQEFREVFEDEYSKLEDGFWRVVAHISANKFSHFSFSKKETLIQAQEARLLVKKANSLYPSLLKGQTLATRMKDLGSIGPNFDDVLYVDKDNCVLETSLCNLFYFQDTKLKTPALREGILDGVTRKYLINRYNIEEIARVSLEELFLSDSVFLTNSCIGVWPVASIQYMTKLYSFSPFQGQICV